MQKRQLQNLILLLLFTVSFLIVVGLGFHQGKKKHSDLAEGIPLEEKIPWKEDQISETSEEAGTIVYITPKGAKYHLYTDCSSLRKSKEIQGVTVELAIAQQRDICSLCKKKSNSE